MRRFIITQAIEEIVSMRKCGKLSKLYRQTDSPFNSLLLFGSENGHGRTTPCAAV